MNFHIRIFGDLQTNLSGTNLTFYFCLIFVSWITSWVLSTLHEICLRRKINLTFIEIFLYPSIFIIYFKPTTAQTHTWQKHIVVAKVTFPLNIKKIMRLPNCLHNWLLLKMSFVFMLKMYIESEIINQIKIWYIYCIIRVPFRGKTTAWNPIVAPAKD